MPRNEYMSIAHFSALIDAFYAASIDPERWPEAAARTASFFASESAAIQVRAGDFSNIALRATTANYDPTAQQKYVTYFHKLDPFANGWRAIGTPGIYHGHQLVDPEVFRRSEIYNDYCRLLGIFHTLGAGTDLGDNAKLMLGIHRPIEREDFATEDQHHLALVLPHLSRAMQVHTLLTTADLHRRVACEMFESLSIAAIAVDVECRMVCANTVADKLLSAGDGLVAQRARLTTRDPRQEAALRQAVCRASAITVGDVTTPGNVLLVRRMHKPPLSVLVAPLSRCLASGVANASAVVFVHEPETRRPSAIAALAALYQLSRAEARLLEALLRGERVAEYADRAGITTNTANTQLKRLFAKTETNRQAELIRRILLEPIVSLAKRGNVGDA
jgi:DNA-binding CsgD family transcriptional regulator